ncbi:MAG: GDP-mannose 4,6-dehydratase [Acidobacteriota bacterium]|nr:GDP-mannose 4,6-dehydratase [Acidobacteriota bacterium]
MKPIIRVENLSKLYQLGGEQKPYSTLRESLIETARKPLKMLKRGDATKAKNQLGWQPKYTLQEMVAEMMESDLKLFA